MAYDAELAARIRAILKRRRGISERKMFGGIAFLVNGNMACGVLDDKVVLRLGPVGATDALKNSCVEPMDFTGKPMSGMVYLTSKGYKKDEGLLRWIDGAVKFARGLPPK